MNFFSFLWIINELKMVLHFFEDWILLHNAWKASSDVFFYNSILHQKVNSIQLQATTSKG